MKRTYVVRTILLAISLLLQLSTFCFHSHGAAGDVDLSFDPGLGVNGEVRAVAVQPDGKVIIGGEFTTVKGLLRTNLARLNADGSGDATFNPGILQAVVLSLALQSDGKVLVGGDLSTVNGIARLNSNGSLDNSFAAGTGANGSVRSVVVHSDGKVVIGGPFCEVNGTYRNGIARLNADGGVDTSFNPGTGASGVEAIALHSNGQVFIGGYFTSVNGTNRNRIARLNADGSLDGSFHPGTGVANPVSSLVLQPDGKVLIGDVTFTNGTSGYGSARLNADGSVDSAFISAGFYPDWSLFYVTCQPEHTCEDTFTVTAAAVQPDGKVMVDGVYHHFGYDPSGYYSPEEYTFYALARFNADGSLDRSFNPVEGNPSVLAFQSDGKMLIGGGPFANGTNYTSISRLYSDGGLDTNFQREYNRL